MDISQTTEADSTQVNFDDLAATSRTVTITGVRQGTTEQPVNIDLAEYPGRAYRPSKSMRRVIVAAWGPETSTYTGRRMTLYGDPTVKFGGTTVGGIKISHLSHIEKPLNVSLTVTRGKRAPHKVEPLPDAPAPSEQSLEPTAEQVAACDDVDVLRSWWSASGADRQAQIRARVDELNGAQA